jgi:hypothetical protein
MVHSRSLQDANGKTVAFGCEGELAYAFKRKNFIKKSKSPTFGGCSALRKMWLIDWNGGYLSAD